MNAANDGFSSDVVAIDAVDVDVVGVGVGVAAVGAGKGVVIVDEGKVFAVVAGGGGCAVSVESILILSFSVALCFFSFSSLQLLFSIFPKLSGLSHLSEKKRKNIRLKITQKQFSSFFKNAASASLITASNFLPHPLPLVFVELLGDALQETDSCRIQPLAVG